jgi:hypothetical protein
MRRCNTPDRLALKLSSSVGFAFSPLTNIIRHRIIRTSFMRFGWNLRLHR